MSKNDQVINLKHSEWLVGGVVRRSRWGKMGKGTVLGVGQAGGGGQAVVRVLGGGGC